ncbi:hypothetical protein SLS56_011978 [Neofusicoccum ribis]|uniref:Uncharacterized protein n=1 Tax=Neofusicoccum ribis TaxID=45134 RepID=A0ABR3SAF4_9PEZI
MSYGHVNPRAISYLHWSPVPVAQGGRITHGQGSYVPASLSLSCIEPMQPSTSMPPLPSNNNNQWDDPSVGKIDWGNIDFGKIDFSSMDWVNIGHNNIGHNNIDHNNVNHNNVNHNNFDFSNIDLDNINLDKIDLGNVDWDIIAPDSTAPDSITPDTIASDTIAPDSIASDNIASDNTTPDNITPDNVTPDNITPDNVTGVRSRHDSLTIDPAWLHGPMANGFVFHQGANLPAEQQQAVPASPERPAKRRRLNSAGDAAHPDPASSAEAEPDVEAPGSPSTTEGSAQDSETDELDVDFWFA